LVMAAWESVLLVEVRDPDRRFPVVGTVIDWAGCTGPDADTELLPESGLGMYVVSQLVDAAGGECGVVTLSGGGKSVFFALPTERVEGL
jgi:signal transduction histidine kinase